MGKFHDCFERWGRSLPARHVDDVLRRFEEHVRPLKDEARALTVAEKVGMWKGIGRMVLDAGGEPEAQSALLDLVRGECERIEARAAADAARELDERHAKELKALHRRQEQELEGLETEMHRSLERGRAAGVIDDAPLWAAAKDRQVAALDRFDAELREMRARHLSEREEVTR